MINPNKDQNQRSVQKTKNGPESEFTDGSVTSINVPGDNIRTDVISPGEGGSDDESDGSTVLPSNPPSQYLYHDIFTMYLCHFLPNDLHLLKDIIQDIITTSASLPKRCTITPIAKFNLEVASWTTTCKATTADSFLVFEDNVGEDGLSSQLTY
jgi:hypothetical protein